MGFEIKQQFLLSDKLIQINTQVKGIKSETRYIISQ